MKKVFLLLMVLQALVTFVVIKGDVGWNDPYYRTLGIKRKAIRLKPGYVWVPDGTPDGTGPQAKIVERTAKP